MNRPTSSAFQFPWRKSAITFYIVMAIRLTESAKTHTYIYHMDSTSIWVSPTSHGSQQSDTVVPIQKLNSNGCRNAITRGCWPPINCHQWQSQLQWILTFSKHTWLWVGTPTNCIHGDAKRSQKSVVPNWNRSYKQM